MFICNNDKLQALKTCQRFTMPEIRGSRAQKKTANAALAGCRLPGVETDNVPALARHPPGDRGSVRSRRERIRTTRCRSLGQRTVLEAEDPMPANLEGARYGFRAIIRNAANGIDAFKEHGRGKTTLSLSLNLRQATS
jgi:hypothetical protein